MTDTKETTPYPWGTVTIMCAGVELILIACGLTPSALGMQLAWAIMWTMQP